MMWLGMFWLNYKDKRVKLLGFSFIFANIPFGRISQAMMGNGDEMVVMKTLFKQFLTSTQLTIVCSFILLAVGLPPVVMALRMLKNKYAWIYVAGFLTLPLVFLLTYVLTALNTLLNKGFLSASLIMGTPVFIIIHTAIALILLILLNKNVWKIERYGKTV